MDMMIYIKEDLSIRTPLNSKYQIEALKALRKGLRRLR